MKRESLIVVVVVVIAGYLVWKNQQSSSLGAGVNQGSIINAVSGQPVYPFDVPGSLNVPVGTYPYTDMISGGGPAGQESNNAPTALSEVGIMTL